MVSAQINTLRSEQVYEDLPAFARAYQRRLRDLDPLLDLVRAKPKASAPGLVPNLWHVRRRNPGLPDSYMAISGPAGEYREPHDRIFDDLALRDLWRSDVAQRFRSEPDRIQQAQRRQAQAARQERQQQALERVGSGPSIQVSRAV